MPGTPRAPMWQYLGTAVAWHLLPHLLRRPQGAHWSSSNQGSRRIEAGQGLQGCGGRRSCRQCCRGRGCSEG